MAGAISKGVFRYETSGAQNDLNLETFFTLSIPYKDFFKFLGDVDTSPRKHAAQNSILRIEDEGINDQLNKNDSENHKLPKSSMLKFTDPKLVGLVEEFVPSAESAQNSESAFKNIPEKLLVLTGS